MKTGTKGVIEITLGEAEGGGGGRYECCLYTRQQTESKQPNTKIERGNAPTMT